MPGRNIVKLYAPESFYHIYNRGVNKRTIFKDASDYNYFVSLFERYLRSDNSQAVDSRRRPYPKLREKIDLLAYCLMPNHFHLLVFQKSDESAVADLMRCIGTAYTIYFNKRYHRRGPLFENHYRAVLVQSDSYLQHISRYIHLNHRQFKDWPYSSYQAYAGSGHPGWLETQPILDLFDSTHQYIKFVSDYEDAQRALEEVKQQLAGY